MGTPESGGKISISLVVFCWIISCASATTKVPRFTTEFPIRLEFSNSTGGKLPCNASGQPNPKISWLMSDGSPAFNVYGLRQVTVDGTLQFPPFRAEDYRQDVHGVAYKCAAINSLGRLVSNEIKVRGLVVQPFDVYVYDVYAIQGNTAVLRCSVPDFLQKYVQVTAWIKDSVLSITKSNFDSTSKYLLLPSGDLHIQNVSSADGVTSYKCQVIHKLTGEMKTSITAGKLMVTDSQGNVTPKINNGKHEIKVKEGQTAVFPCAANSYPVSKISWSKKTSSEQMINIKAGPRMKTLSSVLIIDRVVKFDEGTYICSATNDIGSDSATIRLTIIETLSASISPSHLTIDAGQSAILTCKIIGSPITHVVWLKNGEPLRESGIHQFDDLIVPITKMSSSMVGLYQCFASNDYSSVFAAAIVEFGDSFPELIQTFNDKILQPEVTITLICSAKGNPTPNISWTLFDKMLSNESHRHKIVKSDSANNVITSTLQISKATTEDGGLYRCTAENKAGAVEYAKRIIITGELGMHSDVKVHATAEGIARIDCPFYGYPIDTVVWHKDGELLPSDIRQVAHDNGTLEIHDIQRKFDDGTYTCTAERNDKYVRGNVELTVMVPPKITQFSFQDDLIKEGARARIQCVVSDGESPLTITWLKDGHSLVEGNGISIRDLDEFSSILMISFISPRHNGNYTCVASNAAGVARHTAPLFVNVPPKILPFAFQDDQFFKGMRAHIICAVSQGDLPVQFQWLKDGQHIPSSLGISTRNYDGHANSLSIESVSSAHTGNYTCIASNQAAKVSHTAQLLVQVAPKITPFSFRKEVFEGNLVRISCVVHQGDLPLFLQWQKDGNSITDFPDISTRQIDDYSTILTIEKVQLHHSGKFTCIASNEAATVSHTAQLLVHVPPKIVPFTFQDDNLLEGMLVRVSCVVSRGDLPLKLQWRKDDRPIPDDLSVVIRDFDEYSSVLSIDPIKINHSGNYTCIAKNHAGSVSHTAALKVMVPPRWQLIPQDQIAKSGENLFIHCRAEGFPQPKVTWKKALGSNLRQHSRPIANDDYTKVHSNGTLSFHNARKTDSGLYFCMASNGVGKSLNKVVSVTIQAAPEFQHSQLQYTVKRGEKLQIPCKAEGNWPISYEWFVGEQKVESSTSTNRYKINYIKGDTKMQISNSTLTISWVDRKDSNLIICKAINELGESEMHIYVTVQEQPESPAIITPVEVTNQTVKLNWAAPYRGNSPILKYFIQYQLKSESWVEFPETFVAAATSNSISITNLKPATIYQFRIMAENEIGNSTFSEKVTAKTDETAPSGPPESVDVESTDATTLRVTWTPPKKILWNGSIRGYNIGYRIHGSTEEYQFANLEVPEDYTDDLVYQFPNLHMYTQYDIIVQAYNSRGNGPSSEPVLAMTSEDVPSSAPEDLRCSALSAKTIYVLWNSLTTETLNGILRGYKVLYKPAEEWYDAQIQSKVTQIPKVTLQDLDGSKNYSIQILAFTKMGDGVRSSPVYCKTHEDVPEPPHAVKVLPSSSDSVLVSWKRSSKSESSLIKYNVYYKPIQNGQQQFDLETQRTEELQRDATVLPSHTDSQYLEVKGLKKNQKYAFWVTATSVIGESQVSTVTAQTVADSIVAAKSASFDDIIKTAWKRDVAMPCKAVGVPSPNRKWTIGDHPLLESNRINIKPDGTAYILNAAREDSGNYTCTVYNEHGRDDVKYAILVQVPPSAPILDVVSKSRTSIKLQWKSGPDGGDSIRGYLLHYKQRNGVWSTKEIRPEHGIFSLDDLTCGSTYEIYLEAFNSVGTGTGCDTITVATDGADITLPPKEEIIREGSTFITVLLDDWKSIGCPVESFSAEFKSISSREWTTVGTDIKPTQNKLVISGLVPATWHVLRLTVHTSGGPTVSEYRFATHTMAGGTVPPEIYDESPASPVYIFYLDPLVFIPVVALLAVVIVAALVVCLHYKKHNVSDGTPSETSDLGNAQQMNTWIRRSSARAMAGMTFGQELQMTLSRRSSKDPSPYATAHLSGCFSEIRGQNFVPFERPNESDFPPSVGFSLPREESCEIPSDHYDPPPLSQMAPNV